MVKHKRKINRGLILTVLVLIGVVVYIISITAVRAQYKKEISKVAGDYVATVQSYSMLPPQYRSGSEKMPDDEFDKYVEEMKASVGAYCTDNEEALDAITSVIEANLLSLKEGQNLITEFDRNIKKLSYEFIGDKVTVTLTCQNKYRGSDYTVYDEKGTQSTEGSEPEIKTVTKETSDTIIFQKLDGSWKVVYAYLEIPVEFSDNRYQSLMGSDLL